MNRYYKELSLLETERAILFVKQRFQENLARSLQLYRVSSPLFLSADSGMQDNLNGREKPVSFHIREVPGTRCEIVHSLAKWKRMALAQYGIEKGHGLYTDMNALRPDEDNLRTGIHSIYVDQWDWEKVMDEKERTLDYLKQTVRTVYAAMRETEQEVCREFGMEPFLPEEISFIHSEELLDRYPEETPKERENRICAEKGAVFLIGIGGELPDGTIHDGRAPDYDDWTTPTDKGHKGLNGDILIWNPIREHAFEISSMGIRVDQKALRRQLEIRECTDRQELPWHRSLLEGHLPQTIGGGIGQSRLCMLLLRKRHIGEVQVSLWPDDEIKECAAEGIRLL